MQAFPSTHETRIERDSGGMMRFINPSEALESMIPEWESLLGNSTARDARTEITLLVNGTAYRIRSNRGAIDVAAASGSGKISLKRGDLMHLVTGYRHGQDFLEESRCLLSSEARALFTVVFPKRTPFVWRFDRF
jgi:predicted acetyltransferase